MANMYDKPVNLDFINTYVSPDFNMLMKSGAAMQGRADQAQAYEEQMQDKLLQVNALNKDKELRNTLTAEYEDAISKKLEEVGGSYSKMAPFIREQRKKLHRDLTRGQLGQIQSNYTNWAEWTKKNQERADEQKIDEGDWALAQEKVLKDYSGVGSADDLQGISLEQMVKSNDFHGDALKIGGMMKGNKTGKALVGVLKGQGINLPVGHYERLMRSKKQLTQQEIYNNVLFALKSDPKYKAQLDQHARLKEWELTNKEGWKGWVEEKGGLSTDEVEEMEKMGMNSNDVKDVESYVRGKQMDEFRHNSLRAAAAVAGDTFDYVEYDDQIIHYKDDIQIKGLTDKMDVQAAAFMAEGLGTKTDIKFSDMVSAVSESEKSLKGISENIEKEFSEYGFDELLSPANARNYGGSSEGATVDNMYKTLVTKGGFNMIVNHIANKKGLLDGNNQPTQEAINIADDFKRSLTNVKLLKGKIDSNNQKIQYLTDEAVKSIPESEWNKTYSKYIRAVENESDNPYVTQTLSKESLKEIISNSSTEEELQQNFKNATNYKWHARKKTPMPGAMLPLGDQTGNIIPLEGRALGTATYANAYRLWKKINEKVPDREGVTNFLPRLDMVAEKGTPAAVWNEYASAESALLNPNTSFALDGGNGEYDIVTTVPQMLKDMGIISNVEDFNYKDYKLNASGFSPSIGGPAYEISFNYGDKTIPTFNAKIPMRGKAVTEMANILKGSKDINVRNSMKANLALNKIENWNINQIVTLKEGQEHPVTISGSPIVYNIKKSDGLYSIVALDENNYPHQINNKRYEKPVDLAAGLYDWMYE